MEPNYLKVSELKLGQYYTCRLANRPVVVVNVYEQDGKTYVLFKVFIEAKGYNREYAEDYQLY